VQSSSPAELYRFIQFSSESTKFSEFGSELG
jgi:hypothetical protein